MPQLITKRPERSHIFTKAEGGWYQEPAWVSRRLFEVESFDRDRDFFNCNIYDPACGVGTILREAQLSGYNAFGSDIVKRFRGKPTFEFHKCNFLDSQVRPPVGDVAIVCNPPFDHVEAFCRKAVDLEAAKVAMICLVRRLPAAHWLRELPLIRIWLLTPRPSMPPGEWIKNGGHIGGGKQDFCWLVFERGYQGAPTIGWLHRDQGEPNGQGQA
jgi:hypothetical protein